MNVVNFAEVTKPNTYFRCKPSDIVVFTCDPNERKRKMVSDDKYSVTQIHTVSKCPVILLVVR